MFNYRPPRVYIQWETPLPTKFNFKPETRNGGAEKVSVNSCEDGLPFCVQKFKFSNVRRIAPFDVNFYTATKSPSDLNYCRLIKKTKIWRYRYSEIWWTRSSQLWMRSSRLWMRSSRLWMRSSRLWMRSTRLWTKSSRLWMRSSRVWMRSSRLWMRSSRLWTRSSQLWMRLRSSRLWMRFSRPWRRSSRLWMRSSRMW